MRYLNTLYVTRYKARVRHRRGSLIVSHDEGTQRIPLEELDSVVLFAGQVTTDAISTMCPTQYPNCGAYPSWTYPVRRRWAHDW